jgi:hypothetical protein
LREAGLNHIHLLPSYDFGSVPERNEEQAHVQVRAIGTVGRSMDCIYRLARLQCLLAPMDFRA